MSESALSLLLTTAQSGRNGVLYATKIRFVDGCIKALLYSRGHPSAAVVKILDETIEHATSLGSFALIYKSTLVSLGLLYKQKRRWHAALAGFLGGFFVWGRRSRLHEMINLYIFARVCFACAGSLAAKIPHDVYSNFQVTPFRVWAALTWGFVMMQFEEGSPLQHSLAASMRYLYRDSELRGRSSWAPSLGKGAQYVPFVSALVAVAKVAAMALKIEGPPSAFERQLTPDAPLPGSSGSLVSLGLLDEEQGGGFDLDAGVADDDASEAFEDLMQDQEEIGFSIDDGEE
eukprot:TRINITY_DN121301_c0_g1_i1.p1 TRINITY_DN121301_c0_g1~~TRINITY_DN121301_c0_g1_i1.p1  ORF type:complete len:289 (+),score=61.72 TRINITY_DN121301_c0_g1_i1:34-900(+)